MHNSKQDEYNKCKSDPVYFIKTYCKISNPIKGIIPFDLYNCQKDFINAMWHNNEVVMCGARETGKTTVAATFLLWYIIFNPRKCVAMLHNKHVAGREVIYKLTKMYLDLPYWLTPRFNAPSKTCIKLANDSMLVCGTISDHYIRGHIFDYVILDDFAFIDNRDAYEFFESTYPSFTRDHTRLVISSTPNRVNHFYQLYNDAVRNKNCWSPVTATWKDIPSKDEVWASNTQAVIGKYKFMQEYECDFGSVYPDYIIRQAKV